MDVRQSSVNYRRSNVSPFFRPSKQSFKQLFIVERYSNSDKTNRIEMKENKEYSEIGEIH